MSLWSELNGNIGKTPEQVAAVDMEKDRVKGPSEDLLVDSTDLGKTSKRPIFISVIAIAVVTCLTFSIIGKLRENDRLDTFAVTLKSDGSMIEIYEHQKKVNAYENGEWIYKETPFVSDHFDEIVTQLPVVVWDETFEMIVPDGTMLKWFGIYDETYACIRRFAEENEVNEFFADAEPATYYVVAGASWKGKYVLKSFTNESFTSEFCATVVKE